VQYFSKEGGIFFLGKRDGQQVNVSSCKGSPSVLVHVTVAARQLADQ